MNRINISSILSADLKSRSTVHDFYLFMKNSRVENAVIDFSNVNFATRSFIDEFYNMFIKENASSDIKVTLANVPDEIMAIFDAVSHTQNKEKHIKKSDKVRSFNSVDDFCHYVSSIAF